MSTPGYHLEIKHYLDLISNRYSRLLDLGGVVDDVFDLGKIDYYNIFLKLGPDRARIFAGTNCHYLFLFHIKSKLPMIKEVFTKLNQEVEKLEKIEK